MKKIYLKTLENYIAYANGYNQSKHYDVLLWTINDKIKIRDKLFVDHGLCDDSLCLIFDEMLVSGAYYAHDFVLVHICDFHRFIVKMNDLINEKH
jgi:hypothetical protein